MNHIEFPYSSGLRAKTTSLLAIVACWGLVLAGCDSAMDDSCTAHEDCPSDQVCSVDDGVCVDPDGMNIEEGPNAGNNDSANNDSNAGTPNHGNAGDNIEPGGNDEPNSYESNNGQGNNGEIATNTGENDSPNGGNSGPNVNDGDNNGANDEANADDTNACGGQETLDAEPGTSCADGDGVWECDGDDDVTCNESEQPSGPPCVAAIPGDTVDFGSASIDNTTTKYLHIYNCSPTADVSIESIHFGDDDGGVFSLDDAALPDSLPEGPHPMAPDEELLIPVQYSPVDTSGNSGALVIESNDAAVPELNISLIGTGVDTECPVASAGANVNGTGPFQSSLDAEPLDTIHFSSDGSTSDDDSQLSYEWSILGHPAGSLTQLEPDPFVADPTLHVDLMGTYLVELVVFDEAGVASCNSALVEIDVVSDGDIFIELSWYSEEVNDAYGGPDSNLQIGTDLDIHYLNPSINVEWGSDDSVYWMNPYQDWGSHGMATLDIDSLYGDSPETISHSEPMHGSAYRVGVHYYNDMGYGASEATITVYFDGNIYGQWTRQITHTDHFWYLGEIVWGDGPHVEVLDEYSTSTELNSGNDPASIQR